MNVFLVQRSTVKNLQIIKRIITITINTIYFLCKTSSSAEVSDLTISKK